MFSGCRKCSVLLFIQVFLSGYFQRQNVIRYDFSKSWDNLPTNLNAHIYFTLLSKSLRKREDHKFVLMRGYTVNSCSPVLIFKFKRSSSISQWWWCGVGGNFAIFMLSSLSVGYNSFSLRDICSYVPFGANSFPYE